MNVKIKPLRDNFQQPIKGSEFAGAYDVFASEIIKEEEHFYRVKLGFATEIPSNYRMRISARSSLTKTSWYIPNDCAIIDSDYRGEWEVRFRCIPYQVKTFIEDDITNCCHCSYTNNDFPFKIGDRVAQIYIEPVLDINFENTKELNSSYRGNGGFGSTGA